MYMSRQNKTQRRYRYCGINKLGNKFRDDITEIAQFSFKYKKNNDLKKCNKNFFCKLHVLLLEV